LPAATKAPTPVRVHVVPNPPRTDHPPVWHGAGGAPATPERLAAAAGQLTELLDAHLTAALGREVSLRDAAGGTINLDDSVRYARRAEDAEQSGRWADAAVHWHLALLAAPDDSTMVLRAATALRWAGASTRLFDRYTRLVGDHDLTPAPGGAPREVTPPAVPAVEPARSRSEAQAAGASPRPPSRRPTRR